MTDVDTRRELRLRELLRFRARLESRFASDTAAPGYGEGPPSSGHCAAVSVIARALFGGDFVSAIVDGRSHWFNRLIVDDRLVDADLTADQFGYTSLRLAAPGELYAGTRIRAAREINEETLLRAVTLAERANVARAVSALREELSRRSSELE
jgi:hypothetical protein